MPWKGKAHARMVEQARKMTMKKMEAKKRKVEEEEVMASASTMPFTTPPNVSPTTLVESSAKKRKRLFAGVETSYVADVGDDIVEIDEEELEFEPEPEAEGVDEPDFADELEQEVELRHETKPKSEMADQEIQESELEQEEDDDGQDVQEDPAEMEEEEAQHVKEELQDEDMHMASVKDEPCGSNDIEGFEKAPVEKIKWEYDNGESIYIKNEPIEVKVEPTSYEALQKVSLEEHELETQRLEKHEDCEDGAVVAPTPVVTVPSAEGATGLQLARANSTKAGHRAALLEEIREQNNSFRDLVSSALAPTSGPREPQLQYWDDYFSHLKYECLSIEGNLRSDFTMEMTALVNRWKKLAGTGAEEAGSAHMLHIIAAVDDRKKAVPQEDARAPQTMHTVPSGAMPLVPGTNPLQPASASTVFRAIPQ